MHSVSEEPFRCLTGNTNELGFFASACLQTGVCDCVRRRIKPEEVVRNFTLLLLMEGGWTQESIGGCKGDPLAQCHLCIFSKPEEILLLPFGGVVSHAVFHFDDSPSEPSLFRLFLSGPQLFLVGPAMPLDVAQIFSLATCLQQRHVKTRQNALKNTVFGNEQSDSPVRTEKKNYVTQGPESRS